MMRVEFEKTDPAYLVEHVYIKTSAREWESEREVERWTEQNERRRPPSIECKPLETRASESRRLVFAFGLTRAELCSWRRGLRTRCYEPQFLCFFAPSLDLPFDVYTFITLSLSLMLQFVLWVLSAVRIWQFSRFSSSISLSLSLSLSLSSSNW